MKPAATCPLEQLAVSPQCGFASDVVGNPVSEDDQWRKLELIQQVAADVWGNLETHEGLYPVHKTPSDGQSPSSRRECEGSQRDFSRPIEA